METVETKKCLHYGYRTKERCSGFVSKKDPEHLYCSAHRLTMIVQNSDVIKTKCIISPREENYMDFTTFRITAIL